jgi:hypothetical protein
MISKQLSIICKHCELVENYDRAVSDKNKKWDLHHRLETHFSDGIERPSNAFLSRKELIALDMYYNRPSEELIFLSRSDHNRLHSKNAQWHKALMGHVSPNKGKKLSEETKKKMSDAHKGKKIRRIK